MGKNKARFVSNMSRDDLNMTQDDAQSVYHSNIPDVKRVSLLTLLICVIYGFLWFNIGAPSNSEKTTRSNFSQKGRNVCYCSKESESGI